jgi:hypothetical protein
MKATLDGCLLKIESEAADSWKGKTLATEVVTDPTHGRLLVCGTVKVGRKSMVLKLRLSDKPELAALVNDWLTAIATKREADAAAKRKELDDLTSGEAPIVCHYRDGEYLSGYAVHGPGADMLVKLGLAKEVSGWGISINDDLVKALGASFAYPAAVEYARPAMEAKAAKDAEKKAARDAKFAEARATGKRVVLASWSETRRVNCEGEMGEYLFIVTEYANPDGSVSRDAVNTY